MRFVVSLLIALAFACNTNAQKTALPVKEWKSAVANPLVFYISGDGGFNDFSMNLCKNMNESGYSVSALNSRSFFWSKKAPQQTANEFTNYLNTAIKNQKNQQIIFVGYSFGADVLPFIINRLPTALKSKIKSAIFLTPSGSTDFEIHLSDMMGGGKKRAMDVVAEINRMSISKAAVITDKGEKSFPAKNIILKGLVIETLRGDHHFDGDTKLLTQIIMKYFK